MSVFDDLLTPREVDLIFRYPSGRSLRLYRRGLLSAVQLPDGEVRFHRADIEEVLSESPNGRRPAATANNRKADQR